MQRIDTPTREQDKFGAGKDGFTSGDPGGGIPPTRLSAEWFDDVQESIARVVEKAGIALAAGQYDQLTQAILQLGAGSADYTAATNEFEIPASSARLVRVFITAMGGGTPPGVWLNKMSILDDLGGTLLPGTLRVVQLQNQSGSGLWFHVNHNGGIGTSGKIYTSVKRRQCIGFLHDESDRSTTLLFIRDAAFGWQYLGVLAAQQSWHPLLGGGSGLANASDLSTVGPTVVTTTGDVRFSPIIASVGAGTIWNRSGASFTLYPHPGGTINALTMDAGLVLADDTIWQWFSPSTTSYRVRQIA